jgi:AcrR family transcriptional regulator
MSRPVSIKDETIIEAARQVFLERGIQATTAEVAERAGVSEGSIFKRFKSKGELFRAAMAHLHDELAFARDLAGRVGKADVREVLFETGMEIVVFFRQLMPLHMMAWSNPGSEGLPKALRGPNPPPVRALKNITGYFEAEMRGGRMRRQDPEIVARAFLGSVHTFVFFELLYQMNGELPLAAETYVRGLVSLLWTGIDPAHEGGPPSRAPAAPAAPAARPTPKRSKPAARRA